MTARGTILAMPYVLPECRSSARRPVLHVAATRRAVIAPPQSSLATMPRKTAAGPRLQNTVRLSADGLAKILGDLEARLMQAIWLARVPTSARAIHERIVDDHSVALLTVVTVLNKLVTKRLLRRRKITDLFHYEAIITEEALMAHASRRIVEGVLSLAPEAVTASFVDVLAERDPDQLAELGRLIRRRLRAQEDE